MLSQEIILNNKVLSLGFSYHPFKKWLPAFIQQANKAINTDPASLIQELLKIYETYGKQSAGYRTMLFDFTWAVYEKYPELWSDEEREEGFSDLTARATEFYPELDPEMADLDVYGFNYGQYFCTGMDFCFQAKIKEDIRPLICLAMFQFFDRWSFQYNEEIMEESKDEIES